MVKRKVKTPRKRFLQTRKGAVYHWGEALAKAPGAFEVDGYVAAAYFRSLGVENSVTKEFPPREDLLKEHDDPESDAADEIDSTPAQGLRRPVAPPMKVSDAPATAAELQEMIDGNADGG
jgi:hypothetical protein